MNAAADAPAPTFHCQAQPGKKLGDGEASRDRGQVIKSTRGRPIWARSV